MHGRTDRAVCNIGGIMLGGRHLKDKKANAKNQLLKWIQSKIPHMNIKNLKSDWHDG